MNKKYVLDFQIKMMMNFFLEKNVHKDEHKDDPKVDMKGGLCFSNMKHSH